ncbi:MAG TPA: hypothetical protein PKC54_16000 [Ferruginibacter sp.]|nr:hypothetical protein [Ferruginibacter sp.]
MNATHIHLLLNHFPVIGTLIGSLLLLWGIIKKQHNTRSNAAALLAVMAIIAVPVFLTGEPAEESVEKLPGVSEQMIHLHEEAAEIAFWLMGITGFFSLLALFMAWRKQKMTNTVFILAFVMSAISFAAMARTGYYGGQIRHTEISSGNATGPQNENDGEEKEKNKDKKEEKDDD